MPWFESSRGILGPRFLSLTFSLSQLSFQGPNPLGRLLPTDAGRFKQDQGISYNRSTLTNPTGPKRRSHSRTTKWVYACSAGMGLIPPPTPRLASQGKLASSLVHPELPSKEADLPLFTLPSWPCGHTVVLPARKVAPHLCTLRVRRMEGWCTPHVYPSREGGGG